MTLIMINKEDLYHFENVQDAFLWIEMNPTQDELVILGDDDEQDVMEYFLNENYPVHIV